MSINNFFIYVHLKV